MTTPTLTLHQTLETLYRHEARRVLATLIRLLGDFDLAEEALAEAFASALKQWPQEGVPANPRAWLVSAGRFKAIDQLRRRARFDHSLDDIAQQIEDESAAAAFDDNSVVEDDQLRLIFTCCHPALAPEAQIALTLREVCGLATEAIARAFLANTPTVAQRIVRAKTKIRDANIPYEVPATHELGARLAQVLQVIYLVFNEGYSASTGDSLQRTALSDEAIRLCRLLVELLPQQVEARGLLALMLLHQSRSATRVDDSGDLVLLEAQDRTRWRRDLIDEGCALVLAALAQQQPGPYMLQAAIAAVHAEAASFEATDWREIVGLYDVLQRVSPSPVVELNRAVAVAMRDGPQAGLALVDALLAGGELANYHLAFAARADMHRRLYNHDAARNDYQRALALTTQMPEQRFLQRRLAELAG